MATMVVAVIFGFTWAMVGGAAFYVVAALASRAFDPDAARRPESVGVEADLRASAEPLEAASFRSTFGGR